MSVIFLLQMEFAAICQDHGAAQAGVDMSVLLLLQMKLQQFAWTMAQHRQAQKEEEAMGLKDHATQYLPPLFCMERAFAGLYWSGLVYDSHEVSPTSPRAGLLTCLPAGVLTCCKLFAATRSCQYANCLLFFASAGSLSLWGKMLPTSWTARLVMLRILASPLSLERLASRWQPCWRVPKPWYQPGMNLSPTSTGSP